MIKVNSIITDQNVTVNYNGQTHIVPRNDGLAVRLIDALKKKEFDKIPELVSASKRIAKFSDGQFTVENGEIFVNGVKAPTALSKKILAFSNEGLPCEPLVKFTEKLQKNPSFRAVNELFQFLEKNDHPITEEGNFIAYKRVSGDFKDIYTGTFDNSVGTYVEMPRNRVNEDPTQTCSHGLHVANWDYAHNHYGTQGPESTDIMIEVEVNPADVVAVPTDYNQAKMRVCAYLVLGEIDAEHSSETQIRYTATPVDAKDLNDFNDGSNTCSDCGIEIDDDLDLCDDCYEFTKEESSSSEDESEDEDEYPWNEELK
jgi:hypothetical protein